VHQRGLGVCRALQTILAKDDATSGGVEAAAHGSGAALALDVGGGKRAASLANCVHHEAHHGAFQESFLPPLLAVGVRVRGGGGGGGGERCFAGGGGGWRRGHAKGMRTEERDAGRFGFFGRGRLLEEEAGLEEEGFWRTTASQELCDAGQHVSKELFELIREDAGAAAAAASDRGGRSRRRGRRRRRRRRMTSGRRGGGESA
jgi:hypothetical protein